MTGALAVDVRDEVAVVTLDVPGAPVNTFTRAVRDELVALLDRLDRDQGIRAAVLLSGKADGWIAGADVEELLALPGAAEAERLSRLGQELMDRVEKMRTPIVAAIHGACMGGGLELALACAYRIATESPKTILALPEVQLGLIPGAGGTQRLPHLVGLRAALDMILAGKNVRARKALQTGLVDEVVHPAILRDIAVRRARELVEAGGRDRLRQPRARAHVRGVEGHSVCCWITTRSDARWSSGRRASRRSPGRTATIPHRWPRSTRSARATFRGARAGWKQKRASLASRRRATSRSN